MINMICKWMSGNNEGVLTRWHNVTHLQVVEVLSKHAGLWITRDKEIMYSQVWLGFKRKWNLRNIFEILVNRYLTDPLPRLHTSISSAQWGLITSPWTHRHASFRSGSMTRHFSYELVMDTKFLPRLAPTRMTWPRWCSPRQTRSRDTSRRRTLWCWTTRYPF